MSDKVEVTRLQQAENALARAQHEVDRQLRVLHRVEALGQDSAEAHRKLEELLEALEAAQQEYKAARRSG